jgi:hypothetical protein
MMSSMRGGFRSAVKGVTGQGGDKGKAPSSPTKRFLSNLLTIALVIAVLVMLGKRFGFLR